MPAPDTGSKWRLAALAAILVGVILVAAVLFTNAPNTEDAGMALVRTAAETRTDTLPDGTIITLNKNSTIIYPEAFAGHERRVVLTGEAFFEVTKDAARPFIIDVGEVDVTVLGTSFNVAAYPSSTDIVVVVETGKVKVSDGKENEVLLTPGEMGTYNKASKELIRSVNDDIDYQFWRLKKLVFANTRLEEVVDVLNRQYEAKLSLEDDAAGACRFTATFQDDSLQTILNVLTATFKMELEDGPQGRVLKGKACDGSSL